MRLDALLSEQLHEHHAGQFVTLGPGRQTVDATRGQESLRGDGRVRVYPRRGRQRRAQVFDDVAQALLDERALSVIQKLQAVIDFDRGDNRYEHGIVKRGQRVGLEVGLHQLDLVLLADGEETIVAVLGGVSASSSLSSTLRKESRGMCRPMTTRQTVIGVASTRPTGPQSQVQPTAAKMSAIGDTPVLAP
jgi:hypothetical protein